MVEHRRALLSITSIAHKVMKFGVTRFGFACTNRGTILLQEDAWLSKQIYSTMVEQHIIIGSSFLLDKSSMLLR